MPKAKADDDDVGQSDNGETEKSRGDEGDADDQENVDLTPVGRKIPESGDNLKKRSDYFQKRRS